MNVLIVKLSSMGDLIHALPAITDAVNAIPNIRLDWIVDEAFAEIPKLHPAIENVITTAHRRWRREKWKTFKNGELIQLWKDIRKKKYDVVVDAQNNLKSATITSFTRGLRCGMDRNSARERLASIVCNKTFSIPFKQHAIARQRQLMAQALNYPLPITAPDFGIIQDQLPKLPLSLQRPYLVFIHSTTWTSKHWPESYWQELIKMANHEGYHVVLPWGTSVEHARAERLGTISNSVTVLPSLSITQQASMIFQSSGAICVDTGLGHLTAALNKPAVHIYGPTDPALIGAIGCNQLHLSAQYKCAPCYSYKCKFGKESACFLENMKPEKVWKSFLERVKKTY